MTQLAWEPVAVTALTPYERNPRSITRRKFAHLCKTIAAHPALLEARPIIATRGCDWTEDGTVLAGNMRLRAAVELGWETVPTVYVTLPQSKAREWMLLDNVPFGEWDDDLLAETLYEHHSAGDDMDLTGFSEREWGRLVDAVSGHGAPGVDDAPPVPDDPQTSPGEVIDLGRHRLICGDATDPAVLATLLGRKKAELLWTDPPYGVDYESNGRVTRAKRDGISKAAAGVKTIVGDDGKGLPALLADTFAVVDPHLNLGARFYVAAPPGPRGSVFRAAIEAQGWTFHQALVWVKDSLVLGHSDYHFRHEDVLYGWKPGPGRVGRGAHDGTKWQGGNDATTVFEIDRPRVSDEHPHMKPCELVEAHLRNSTRRGDLVLDVFAGSGTTLIACERLGRRAALVELDPGYCDVIRERYAAHVAEVAARAA